MAILGITNRTENWKTACYFAPLFGHGSVRVARRLLAEEKERAKLHPGDVRLELFWYGMRDYFDQEKLELKPEEERLANTYSRLFPLLQEKIQEFGKFRAPKESYDGSRKSEVASNLFHTEVDIVLESPTHLFIGEAKHLSTFGASGKDILTHQLIRQYVMACILVELSGQSRRVVPFVVGDSRAYLEKTLQVQFMLEQGWMRETNILEWSKIEELW